MAFGNVIPIDSDVAQQLSRRQLRFRLLVAGLTALWLAILVPTLVFSPLPPLAPFAALAVLVVLAEHRFVLFGDETSMSASIIVVVASIFVFADTAPLAGPILIASIGGLYLPHIRTRALGLTVANASIFGTSAAVSAALTIGSVPLGSSSAVSTAVAAALLASTAYWYSNSVLTGLAAATRLAVPLPESVRAQAVSDWPVLFLTMAAGLAAVASDGATLGIVMALAALVVAFEIYLRVARCSTPSAAALAIPSCALTLGGSAVAFSTGLWGAAVSLVATFLVVAPAHAHGSRRSLALTAACTIAVGGIASHLSLPVPIALGLCVTASICLLAMTTVVSRSRRLALRVPRSAMLGLLIPGRAGLAYATAFAVAFSISAKASSGVQAAVAVVGLAPAVLATLPIKPEWKHPRACLTARRSAVGACR